MVFGLFEKRPDPAVPEIVPAVAASEAPLAPEPDSARDIL